MEPGWKVLKFHFRGGGRGWGEELLIGGIQEFSSSGLSKIELSEIHLCKYDFGIFPLFLRSFFRWRERWRQLFQGINNDIRSLNLGRIFNGTSHTASEFYLKL